MTPPFHGEPRIMRPEFLPEDVIVAGMLGVGACEPVWLGDDRVPQELMPCVIVHAAGMTGAPSHPRDASIFLALTREQGIALVAQLVEVYVREGVPMDEVMDVFKSAVLQIIAMRNAN
jgi:hypothetical protein